MPQKQAETRTLEDVLLLQLLRLLVLARLTQRLQAGQDSRVQRAWWWYSAPQVSLFGHTQRSKPFPARLPPPRALLLGIALVLAFSVAGVAVAEGAVLSHPALQDSLLILGLVPQRVLTPLRAALQPRSEAKTQPTAGVYPQPGVRDSRAGEQAQGRRALFKPRQTLTAAAQRTSSSASASSLSACPPASTSPRRLRRTSRGLGTSPPPLAGSVSSGSPGSSASLSRASGRDASTGAVKRASSSSPSLLTLGGAAVGRRRTRTTSSSSELSMLWEGDASGGSTRDVAPGDGSQRRCALRDDRGARRVGRG